jgi:hypothetical protein
MFEYAFGIAFRLFAFVWGALTCLAHFLLWALPRLAAWVALTGASTIRTVVLPLASAPGTGEALRRAWPARAAATLSELTRRDALIRRVGLGPGLSPVPPRSAVEALWIVTVILAAGVASAMALSLAWRTPVLQRLIVGPLRRAAVLMNTGAAALGATLLLAAAHEVADAVLHAPLTTHLWCAAAVRCIGAVTCALCGTAVLNVQLYLVKSAALHRAWHALPNVCAALLCAGAGVQTAWMPPPALSEPAVRATSAALVGVAAALLCRGLSLGALRELVRQAVLLQPMGAQAGMGGLLALCSLLYAASATMLLGSALVPMQPSAHRAAFAAAAIGQSLVAAMTLGCALQSRAWSLARAGMRLEAVAARLYRQLDVPILLPLAIATRLVASVLALLLAAALACFAGLPNLMASTRRIFQSAHVLPGASLAVVLAALLARAYAAQLFAAAAGVGVTATTLLSTAVAVAHGVLAAALPASRATTRGALRAAAASANAALALGVHASPPLAAVLAALHVAQAAFLRQIGVFGRTFEEEPLEEEEPWPAGESDGAEPDAVTEVTSFCARNCAVALLLPLLCCHVCVAALGVCPDGQVAAAVRFLACVAAAKRYLQSLALSNTFSFLVLGLHDVNSLPYALIFKAHKLLASFMDCSLNSPAIWRPSP